MQSLKDAVGLGKKDQQGQEPASGVKGEGSAGEPFDQGNQENDPELGGKSAQQTDSSTVTGDTSKTADEATVSGKSDEPSASTSIPSAAGESETSKEVDSKKPKTTGGSWLKNVIGKRKDEGDQQVTSGASKETTQTASDLPPNHLGEDVPEGPSTEPIADETPAMADVTNEAAPNASEDPQAQAADREAQAAATTKTENAVPEEPKKSGMSFLNPFSSSDKKESVQAPESARRTSREAYGSNPHAIPVAGGVRVGSVAYERRKSMAPPKSPEPVFEESTNLNTASNAEASSSSKDASAKESIETNGAKSSDMTSSASPATDAKNSVDNTPRSTSLGSPTSDKGRRKSFFDKVKEKVKT